MNLLFLSSRVPYPPNRGDKVRTFAFLKELSKICNITLISFIESKNELIYEKELSKYCNDVILIKKNKLH